MPAFRTALFAALLACCTGAAMAGTIYQWKDAKGVTHSSDKPPVGVAYEVRRIDTRDTASHQAAPVTTPEGRPVESPQCTTARANLELLQGSGPVEQEVDGKRQPLDDAQRTSQRQLAEAAIKVYCPAT